MTADKVADKKRQPSDEEIKRAIFMTKGPITNYRVFKNTGQRSLRAAMKEEFSKAVKDLETEQAGVICSFRAPRARQPYIIFVKKKFDDLPLHIKSLLERHTYEEEYRKQINHIIIPAVR